MSERRRGLPGTLLPLAVLCCTMVTNPLSLAIRVARCAPLVVLLAAVLSWPFSSLAQPDATVQAPVVNAPAAALRAKPSRSAAVRTTKPLWNELSPVQREALAPLANHWNLLSETQKRKWLLVSKNYREMPPAEQARLHGRMNEWVALSPQQRQAARFNFYETKRLSSDEKQKKWQAYQALSPDDRRRFVEDARPAASGAAVAVKPVPRQKLAPIAAEPGRPPRIAGLNQIDPRTLLPQRGAASSTLVPKQNGR